MIGKGPSSALELRFLAGHFREFATETQIELFRRKFESVASELEEAALDAETRAMARLNLRRAFRPLHLPSSRLSRS